MKLRSLAGLFLLLGTALAHARKPVIDLIFDIDRNFAFHVGKEHSAEDSQLLKVTVTHPDGSKDAYLIERDFPMFIKSLETDPNFEYRISFSSNNVFETVRNLLHSIKLPNESRSLWDKCEGRLLAKSHPYAFRDEVSEEERNRYGRFGTIKRPEDFNLFKFPHGTDPPVIIERTLVLDDQAAWMTGDSQYGLVLMAPFRGDEYALRPREAMAALAKEPNFNFDEGQKLSQDLFFDRNRWTIFRGMLAQFSANHTDAQKLWGFLAQIKDKEKVLGGKPNVEDYDEYLELRRLLKQQPEFLQLGMHLLTHHFPLIADEKSQPKYRDYYPGPTTVPDGCSAFEFFGTPDRRPY